MPGIAALRIVSDRGFPRHSHDQFGIGVLGFGAHRSWSGRGPVEAEAGDVITVNPGEMHDGSPVAGRARGWRMLYLDPTLAARAVQDEVPHPFESARPVVRDRCLAGHVERLFRRLTEVGTDPLAVEEDLLRTVMHWLLRHGGRPAPLPAPPPCVARALRRLDEAPHLPVSLAELAALSGVSRFQLLRGFSRTVGTTPHAYRLQRRVGFARRLLAAGSRPAAAAAEAGFADQSHLTRAFVRQFGVTPGRYRAALGRTSRKL
ncbi:MAG: AraC family transcriptional regulator [Methylobacterium frigidaeris]